MAPAYSNMDDDAAYLAEVSDTPRPDNLNDDIDFDAAPPPAKAEPKSDDLSGMTRSELLSEIQGRWDSDPEHSAFTGLKRRDVNRYKKAQMRDLLTNLIAQGAGRSPALPEEFDDPDSRDAAALNPDALDTLGEAMATFNRITVEVVEKASQVWQPGGYVLEGTGDYLGRPDVHTAMKGVMKEIALEAGPSDPIVQLVSSPWARYGLIMSAAMGSTAKKVTAAPPL